MISVLNDDDSLQISDYEELSDERDYSEVFLGTALDSDFYRNFVLRAKGQFNQTDYIMNPLSWPICSKKLSDVLLDNCTGDIKINDINVLMKEGGSIPLKVVNLMRGFECFNFEKGQVRLSESPSGKKYISAIYDWVFDAEKIPKSVSLFRVSTMRSAVFIRAPLAELLLDSGMKGFGFIDDVTLV
jgi:hypothetical protein